LGLIGLRGRVLTLDPGNPFIRDGLVVIDTEKGLIVDVTSYEKGEEHGIEEVVGSRSSVVMPGLVNTHNHAPMYLFKGTSIGLTGLAWLKEIWRLESCLKPHHIYWGSLASIYEMLLSGITLFGDMYFYEEEAVRACHEAGVRCSLSLGVIELFEGPPKHTIEESISFAERHRRGEFVRGMIGVHALYSVSSESIREASEVSWEEKLRLHMHFAESMDEVEVVRKLYGMTPAEAAESLGVLSAEPLLAHAVYVGDRDLELLSRHRPYISYCPFTIMSWGSGIARVAEMMERGVRVTIGTDGPATAGWMNVLFEMKVALAAQGSLYSTPQRVSPWDLLRSSVVEGARALGWEDVGVLRRGFKADVVLLEPTIPIELEDHISASHRLVYDFGLFSVKEVFVGGRRVVSGGRILSIDVERVFKGVVDARRDIVEGCGRR